MGSRTLDGDSEPSLDLIVLGNYNDLTEGPFRTLD